MARRPPIIEWAQRHAEELRRIDERVAPYRASGERQRARLPQSTLDMMEAARILKEASHGPAEPPSPTPEPGHPPPTPSSVAAPQKRPKARPPHRARNLNGQSGDLVRQRFIDALREGPPGGGPWQNRYAAARHLWMKWAPQNGLAGTYASV